jgi:hypothetical protein
MRRARGGGLRGLFLYAVLSAGCALAEQLIRDGGLFERSPSTEFLEDSGPLVFLLKSAERAIDRLVLLNNNTYHVRFTSFFYWRVINGS